jgi:hypothetical protein
VDIAKLFRDAWGLFRLDMGPLVAGMLVACIVPSLVVGVIAVATVWPSLGGITTDAHGDVTGLEPSSVALWVVGGVVIVVVAVFLTVPLLAGLLEGVLLRVREGRRMGYGDAIRGFRMFGRAVGVAVLVGVVLGAVLLVPVAVIVATGVGHAWAVAGLGVLLLLVAVVAYVYLSVRWLYVLPLVVDRGAGVTRALGQSAELVRGRWWRTFLAWFVLTVVLGVMSAALGVIPLVGSVLTIVLYPFVLTYVVAMYLQARGEGALVDAVTGYVAPGSTGAPPAYSQPASPYPPPAAPYAAPMAPAPSPPPAAPYTPPAADGGGADLGRTAVDTTAPAAGGAEEAVVPEAPLLSLTQTVEPPVAPEPPEAPSPPGG